MSWPRRQLLLAGAASLCALPAGPARANFDQMMAAVRVFSGGAMPQPGRVRIDIEPLVENGNAVPVSLSVQSPMSAAEHVQRLALFSELNPQREVFACTLTPAMGRAQVATRIRLATSQRLVAVAACSDGSFWSHQVEVVVTLAACVE